MSDRTFTVLTLGVSIATLYITYRMAMALQDAQKKIDSVAGASTPLGQIGAAFGW